MPDDEKGFDINFKLLPPDLQMKLWILGLDANSSKVNIAYKSARFTTSLAYNYGGNAEATLLVQRAKTTLGVNPVNGAVDLSVVYRGFKFGASASPSQKSAGASIGYGAELLPFPPELESIFVHANGGLASMANDIAAAPNNPRAWLKMHGDDAATLSRAVQTIQHIAARDGKSSNLGAGLKVNYTPQLGLTIYGGVQFNF